jgi:hypothetical protein
MPFLNKQNNQENINSLNNDNFSSMQDDEFNKNLSNLVEERISAYADICDTWQDGICCCDPLCDCHILQFCKECFPFELRRSLSLHRKPDSNYIESTVLSSSDDEGGPIEPPSSPSSSQAISEEEIPITPRAFELEFSKHDEKNFKKVMKSVLKKFKILPQMGDLNIAGTTKQTGNIIEPQMLPFLSPVNLLDSLYESTGAKDAVDDLLDSTNDFSSSLKTASTTINNSSKKLDKAADSVEDILRVSSAFTGTFSKVSSSCKSFLETLKEMSENPILLAAIFSAYLIYMKRKKNLKTSDYVVLFIILGFLIKSGINYTDGFTKIYLYLMDGMSKVENPIPQISESEIDESVYMISTLFNGILLHRVGGNMEKINSILLNFGRLQGSLKSIITGALKIIQKVIDFICRKFSFDGMRLIDFDNPILEDFFNRSRIMHDKMIIHRVSYSQDLFDELITLELLGTKLYKEMGTSQQLNNVKTMLMTEIRMLNAFVKEFASSNFQYTGFRQETVGILFQGGPDSGKSIAMQALADLAVLHLLDRDGDKAQLKEYWDNPASRIYNRQFEASYYSGYNFKHQVIMFDDLGQCKDKEGNPDNEWMNIVRAINSFEYNLHMDNILEKGKTIFRAKALIASTNLHELAPESIVSHAAINRRFHLRYVVAVKDKYAARPKTDIWSKGRDITKLPTVNFNGRKISEFNENMLDFFPSNDKGEAIGDPISFKEVFQAFVLEERKRNAWFEFKQQNYEKNLDKLKSMYSHESIYSIRKNREAVPQSDLVSFDNSDPYIEDIEMTELNDSDDFDTVEEVSIEIPVKNITKQDIEGIYSFLDPDSKEHHSYVIPDVNLFLDEVTPLHISEEMCEFVSASIRKWSPTQMNNVIMFTALLDSPFLNTLLINMDTVTLLCYLTIMFGKDVVAISKSPADDIINFWVPKLKLYYVSAATVYKDNLFSNPIKLLKLYLAKLKNYYLDFYPTMLKNMWNDVSNYRFLMKGVVIFEVINWAYWIYKKFFGVSSDEKADPGPKPFDDSIFRADAQLYEDDYSEEDWDDEVDYMKTSVHWDTKQQREFLYKKKLPDIFGPDFVKNLTDEQLDFMVSAYYQKKSSSCAHNQKFPYDPEDGECYYNKPQSFGYAKTSQRSRNKNKNTIRTTRIKPQMCPGNDSNGYQIYKKVIKSNHFIVYAEDSNGELLNKAGYMTVVKGRVALLPKHFITSWKGKLSSMKDYGSKKVRFSKSAELNAFSFIYTIDDILKTVRTTDTMDMRDLVVLDLPNTFQPCPDIIDRFPTIATAIRHKYNLKAVMAFIDKEKLYWTFNANVRDVHLEVSGDGPGMQYTVRDTIEYNGGTQVGDCGALLGVMNSRIPKAKIFGIHVAGGHNGTTGYSVIVTQEMLNEHACIKQAVSIEDHPLVVPEDGLSVSLGQFNIIGTISPKPSVPFKSNITTSVMYGSYTKPISAPARLTWFRKEDGSIVDPWELALAKYCLKPIYIPQDVFSQIGDQHTNWLMKVSTKYTEFRVYSIEEAILGVLEEENFHGISSSSSAGFPMNTNLTPDLKKNLFSQERDSELFNLNLQKLVDEVREVLLKYKNGIVPNWYFVGQLKDEKLPLTKVLNGKARYFSAGPVIYLIIFKMYFGAFAAWMFNNKIVNGSCAGINDKGPHWNELARSLSTFDSDIPYVGAGDYSGFDGSERPVIHWEILDLIQKVFKFKSNVSDEEERIRSLLWIDLCFSHQIIKGVVVGWCSSLPSGHPYTLMVNCLYNHLAFRYCWFRLVGNSAKFEDFVVLQVVGDDNIFSVHFLYRELFNEMTLTGPMSEIGLKYTSETKEISILPFRKLTEVEFCKRSFRFDEVLHRWVGPIRLDSILQVPFWVPKGMPEVVVDNVETTIYELALHEESVFIEWRSKILKAFDVKCAGLKFKRDVYLDYHNMKAIVAEDDQYLLL